jgi:hypothetical protein
MPYNLPKALALGLILVGIIYNIFPLFRKKTPTLSTVSGSSSSSGSSLQYYSYRYDPEIYNKSGGMAGYSTTPFDTNPDGGYINYPYYTQYPYHSQYPHQRGVSKSIYPLLYMPIRDTPRYVYNPFIDHNRGYYPQSLLFNRRRRRRRRKKDKGEKE